MSVEVSACARRLALLRGHLSHIYMYMYRSFENQGHTNQSARSHNEKVTISAVAASQERRV